MTMVGRNGRTSRMITHLQAALRHDAICSTVTPVRKHSQSMSTLPVPTLAARRRFFVLSDKLHPPLSRVSARGDFRIDHPPSPAIECDTRVHQRRALGGGGVRSRIFGRLRQVRARVLQPQNCARESASDLRKHCLPGASEWRSCRRYSSRCVLLGLDVEQGWPKLVQREQRWRS